MLNPTVRPVCRLVIFDCDGVMFDSRSANEAFYNDIRNHFGMPPLSPEELEYAHMATAEEAIDHIIPDPEIRKQAQAHRLTVDYRDYNRLLVMEPHLVALLEYLRPKYKTAVCTNRSNTIGPLLKENDLDRHFDTVVSSLDVSRPKPDPEAVLLVLERLGVPAAEALYIGDSSSDAQAAGSAGVSLAAYRNPSLKADYHIDGLDQVAGILDSV